MRLKHEKIFLKPEWLGFEEDGWVGTDLFLSFVSPELKWQCAN